MKFVRSQGFSLIELLVVISIIALLAGLLFPVLGRAMEKSRRATCRSNLRDIGISLKNYAADNSGWYVLSDAGSNPDGSPKYTVKPDGSVYLAGEYPFKKHVRRLYTNGYIRTGKVFVCPSDKWEYGAGNARINVKAYPEKDYPDPTFGVGGGFESQGNCSYMYIAGYGVSSVENAAMAGVLVDESNDQERGDRTPGEMPNIGAEDNHGANYRNVLYLDGHVDGLEGPTVANQQLFGSLKNTAILNSVD